MAEVQLVSQLKFRVASLESALSDRQRELEDLRGIETQADSKITAMTKIHNDKVKSLLNSIQILKKQKASLEGLSKEHKRSKLIQQLNKEILDQDLVIDVLRKFVYDDKGKIKGREICDDIIVTALKKGPERVRAVTREQLRMEIQKLKAVSFSKTKGNGDGANNKVKDFGEASEVSQLSQHSFVNQNEEIFKKFKDVQTENQNLKLQISTKGKIIQKLKNEAKEKDRLKSEVELLTNQLEVSGRKVYTFQRLLRETKQNMHTKIGELFERELKVQELQMNSKESGERLKQAHQSTNLLIEEIRQEKEQLRVEIELLKKENEGLMLEKMSMKNRQDEQKKKIQQIREITSKNKEELGVKLTQLQAELQKLNQQNTRLTDLTRQLEAKYFNQRQQWIEERQKLSEQGDTTKANFNQAVLEKDVMQQLDKLRKQNRDLKELLESGTGGSSDNKILLQRLQNYRIRLQLYQSNGGKGRERQLYDQLFDKYNNILIQYEKLKKMVPSEQQKQKRLNIVEITTNEEQKLHDISSGISALGLEDIGSDILDNYDSSYDYELRVDEVDRKKFKGIPKITEEDKELLKLISSDLWCFVKDDRLQNKINEVLDVSDKYDEMEQQELADRIRKIKNLSHPQGKKIVVYDSQLKEMEEMSENVSITSAVQKQIDRYDSDIDIEVQKTIQGSPSVNMRELGRISDSYSEGSMISSVKSGESGFVRRKKGEKASVIKISKEQKGAEQMVSSSVASDMNSSVSSVGVNESLLAEMNSDISIDFRKRKNKK